jgi:hypothetical protein
LPRPAEDHFYRPRTRCILARPGGEKPAQRALSVYRAAKRRFTAPRFSAPVGDALSDSIVLGRTHHPPEIKVSERRI